MDLIEKQMQAEIQKKNEKERERLFNADYFDRNERESPLGKTEPTNPAPGGSASKPQGDTRP